LLRGEEKEMSITIEEAYSSVQFLYKDLVVTSCEENDVEWVFNYERADSKPPVPGDIRSAVFVNKSNGAVTPIMDRYVERFGGFFLKKILSAPTEKYKPVDISAIHVPKVAVAV
jgi:hypothetical protein